METLDFIRGRVLLRYIINQMVASREELESKHPTRTDLIEPLATAENELKEVHDIIIKCENEIENRGRQLCNYERIILEQKARIKELENEVKFKNVEL
jgi:hypothetical protein